VFRTQSAGALKVHVRNKLYITKYKEVVLNITSASFLFSPIMRHVNRNDGREKELDDVRSQSLLS
jgi:hypothetical protein